MEAYSKDGIEGSAKALFIHRLNETRVAWGPPDRAKIPAILEQAKSDWPKEHFNPFAEESKVKNVIKVLDTDKKLELFLRRCGEPMLKGYAPEDEMATMIIEDIMGSGDLDTLLETATALERKYCSWEATVGPALKAIRRLGRTSAGKDVDNLARYAQIHEKPKV